MKVKQRLLVSGLFIAGIFLLSGQNVSPVNVTLHGRVTDSSSGQGVAGVTLTISAAEDGSTLASGVLTDSQGNYEVSLAIGTALESSPELPDAFWMDVPSPNPAHGSGVVNVRYASPGNQRMEPRLEVVDMLGRSVSPDSRLAAGAYFLRLWFDDGSISVSKQLVVSEAGNIQFELLRQSREVPSDVPAAAKGASMSTSSTLYVRIEKTDYVSDAQQIRLEGTAISERNFQISRASSNVVLGDREVLGWATADATGTVIGVVNPASPLYGLEIEIPEGSLTAERTISIAYSDVQSHTFGSNFNVISPAMEIDLDGGYTEAAVNILVPVTVPTGHFAMAFMYDEATGTVEGLPATGHWSNFIKFSTRNLNRRLRTNVAGKDSDESPFLFPAKIIVASIPSDFLDGLSEIDSGFRPGVDDFEFPNNGSIIADGGHCSGQSVAMLWYYAERRLKGQPALNGAFDRVNTTAFWQDNPKAYRLASVLQEDHEWNSTSNKILLTVETTSELHLLSWYAFGYSILLTGLPQYVGLTSDDGGHAIVAYKVVPSERALYVADPNFPGDERKIMFNGTNFEPYSTKQNATETSSHPYTGVGYYAVSAMIDWDHVGRRWLEFDDDSVGRSGTNAFPETTILYQTDSGFSELTDGLSFDTQTITLTSQCMTCEVTFAEPGTVTRNQMLVVYNNSGDSLSAGSSSDELVEITLVPGLNELGLHTSGFVAHRDSTGDITGYSDSWLDFRWTTVNFTGSSTGDQITWHLDFDAYRSWLLPDPVPMTIDANISFGGQGATLTVDSQDTVVGRVDVGSPAHLTITPTFAPTDSTILVELDTFTNERYAVGPARFGTIDQLDIRAEPTVSTITQNATTGALTFDFTLWSDGEYMEVHIPFYAEIHMKRFDFDGNLASESRETIEAESLRLLIVATGVSVTN